MAVKRKILKKIMKKNLITALVFLFVITGIKSQHAEDKRFCFEPVFGVYQIEHDIKTADNIFKNVNSYGFKFGLLKNIGIKNFLVIRPQASFSGHKRRLTLRQPLESDNISVYNDNEFFINASLHMSQNFSSGAQKTFPYLVQGMSYHLNLNHMDAKSKLWIDNNYSATIDIGAGLRLYNNRKHILAIELLYSFGINDRKSFGYNIGQETFTENEARTIFNKIDQIKTHFLTLQVLL